MTRLRLGVGLAMSAVAVNGPLLVLALLHADGVPVPRTWRVVLLTIRALATVAALSLGAAYIAHGAVTSQDDRARLLVVWLLVLGGTAVIITPMVVDAIGSALAPVIPSVAGRWLWALVSVVTVEVSGAGCMLAAAGAASRNTVEGPAAKATDRASWEPPAQPPQVADSPAAGTAERAPSAVALAARAECRCGFCGRHFGSPYALGGHVRHCRLRRRTEEEPVATE
jgi:hypothetical protein